MTVKQEDVLCDVCRRSFSLIEGDICDRCGRSFSLLDETYRQGECCADCLRWQQDDEWSGMLTKNRSVYVYDDFMKEVVSRWKFRGDYALVEAFRIDVRREFFRHFSSESLLIPIPLSRERLYERGFNQAKALADLLFLPVFDVLERHDSEKQSKKSRYERLRTAPFRLHAGGQLQGKSVVIIDDIYTTGSTVYHAARLLKEAGACDVCSFTLIRA